MDLLISAESRKRDKILTFITKLKKQKVILFMLLPALLVTFIFHYIPIFGIVIAFKKYNVGKGIWGSDWVGLKWFIQFFKNPYYSRIVRNTVVLGVTNFVICFPAPIILALLLNEIRHNKYKRIVQTISYLPHFISTVIIIGMVKVFTSRTGIFNNLLELLGKEKIMFFTRPEWFRPLYIGSALWQGIGWGTIIYLASLSNVSLELYEAAILDGANRFQRVWHVTIPAIIPTVTILFILNIPGIIGSDTEKILLMYSPQTYETADVIGTYVYREGIEGGNFSYSAAVGLMLSCVSFILLFVTNWVSKKTSENSLW